MIKLGDVISLDKTIKVDIQDNIEYTIAGVQSYGKGVLNKRKELGINMTMKQYQLIEPNQLMWCKVDTKNGAFGVTKTEHKGSLASTNMCLAKIKTDKILPEFLEKLFRIKFFHENITHLSSGTTNRKYLTPNQLCDLIYIPNFTIQEQKDFLQFVNKLESSPIFSHIDYQLTQLENLNQAILQEAVQGKLVPQDPKDEPASELLERIKLNRVGFQPDPNENNIGLKPINSGINRTGFKPRPIKELPPIKPEEIPFEIPENWVWCRLGDIIDMIYGDSLTKAQCIEGAEYPVFGSNGIVGYFNKYLTDKRTIVVGRKGSAGALNVCHTPSWTTDVAYYIEETDFLDFDFTYYLLKSLKLEELGKGIKPGVNRNEAYNITIPLPPLSEQKRIVAEIEKQFAKTKQLKEHIIANQQATEQLLKALLHQAFR